MAVDYPDECIQMLDDRFRWRRFCVMWSFISFQMRLDRALADALGNAANNISFDFIEDYSNVGY